MNEIGIFALGLVPVAVLVKWSEWKPGVTVWELLSVVTMGGVMMSACLFFEAQLGTNSPDVAGWVKMVVLAPMLEEMARWCGIFMLGIQTVSLGTLLGGAMGLAETAYKLIRLGGPGPIFAFILVATIPLHALMGGILVKCRYGIILTILFHGIFNAGLKCRTGWGGGTALLVLWAAFLVWIRRLGNEGELSSPEGGEKA